MMCQRPRKAGVVKYLVRSILGKINKCGRDLGYNVAGAVKQIIKMMPSHDIASLVFGSVNLLMNVRSSVP